MKIVGAKEMSNTGFSDDFVYHSRCDSDVTVELTDEIANTFSSSYKSNSRRSNAAKWKSSLDELVKWHGQLETALLLDYKVNPKQEYRGLLFTSSLTEDDFGYLINYLSDVKLKCFYPVYIFNYLSKITRTNMALLKRDSIKIIQDQFCSPNIPRFLKLNGTEEDNEYESENNNLDYEKKHSKSMSKLYTETLRTKIKYGFIHVATFFKILSLPICAESDKQKCLAWYYASYNKDRFKLQRNLNMFLYSPLGRMESIISPDHRKEILNWLNAIFDELNYINIKVDELSPVYSEALVKYFKGERFVDEGNVPFGLARRFDYYTGKYLFDLMEVNHKEEDLLKLVDIHISADSATFFNDSYTLHEVDDIEFKSISKYEIHLSNGRLYTPISVFMLSEFTKKFSQNSIMVVGEIKSIRGKLRNISRESEQVTCVINDLKCTDDSNLVIQNICASGSKLRDNFFNYPWAVYIMAYLILYEGYEYEYIITSESAYYEG